jgi:hypothetical protein
MIQSRSAAAESAYGDLGVKKAPPSLDSLAQGLGGHPGKQLHIAAQPHPDAPTSARAGAPLQPAPNARRRAGERNVRPGCSEP